MAAAGTRIEVVGPERLPVCHAIRRAVFIEGQGVAESEDVDGRDAQATQLLASEVDEPVGTARLRLQAGVAKAERVAVLERVRGRGIGRALMAVLEVEAARRGAREVLLHAQEAVVPFYEKLGYVAEGEGFVEAGIPHRRMRKRLG